MIRFRLTSRTALILCLALLFTIQKASAQFPKKNLNVIIITADDLGPDGLGLGSFGAKMPGITPNLDALAAKSVKIYNAHVNSAICVPSRGILATGRYPFHSHQHGFFLAPDSVPTMIEGFQRMGYKAGLLSKVLHSSVKATTRWDYVYDVDSLGSGRSPQKYYERTKAFIQTCRQSNQPFYFMINSDDPHRPFQEPQGPLLPGAEWPSKMYDPKDVFVPGFLPDLPEVRTEISHYYNSVRRLDDIFGKVMQAIREVGDEKNTLVIFFSDNGISMPFSKANAYLRSTKTAFMAYLPGTLKPREDKQHYVSTVDLFPTIMEMVGGPKPLNVDGTSFLPILQGKDQKDKDKVFTQIDFLNSGLYAPMRSVQDKDFGYIFNPWSDGKKVYRNGNEGETFKAMEAAGKTDAAVQERVRMFRYRDPEELYDLKTDPDCLHNLANNKQYAGVLKRHQQTLKTWMAKYNDPLLAVMNLKDQPEAMRALLDKIYSGPLQLGKVRIP